MKQILLLLLIVLPFCVAVQSCSPADDPLTNETEHPLSPSDPDGGDDPDNGNTGGNDNTNKDTPMNREIVVSIGDAHYTATLEDNPAAKAFIALLPITVTMTEMNGNEKYYNLSENLPADTFRPGTVHAGDLLLWGANTVVLFYDTFSSAYSYTPLGKIKNPQGLGAALGNGKARVTFAVQ